MSRAFSFFTVLLAAALAAAASPKPELKFIIILSRHGVRSPTWEAARLNQYSAEPWPSWGVAPGELTPHGREQMRLMGSYYRDWLTDEHLIHSQGCSDAPRVYIWADTSERTIESGRALAETMLPGCALEVHSQTVGSSDPVFAGSSASAGAARESREPDGPDSRILIAQHRAAFEALQSVLGSGTLPVLAADALEGDPPQSAKEENAAEFFDVGSSLSEDLLLEYADGMQGNQLGWGRLTRENLLQALELHAVYTDLTRRAPAVARLRGTRLLQAVLDSLEQVVAGRQIPGAIGSPSDSVLVLVGHDTNQSNISGMMNLNWSLPGYQPNDTPPGGALIFSLWEDPATRQFSVTMRYVAQTPDQMRLATPLSISRPPAEQELSVKGCQGDTRYGRGCSWGSFKRVLEDVVGQDSVESTGRDGRIPQP